MKCLNINAAEVNRTKTTDESTGHVALGVSLMR